MRNFLRSHWYLLIVWAVWNAAAPAGAASPDPFPVFPAMAPNVAFWEKVYTRYSTREGILHDSRNLAVIYGTVALLEPAGSRSRKINRRRIKAAKYKYRRILEKLALGQAPRSAEEKRVARLFGPAAGRRTFRRAMDRIRCQIGQKNRFREGLIRSGAYIDEIRRVFRSEGLPADLAYLPHVESSFNPAAYSKFGAAGMWQFTRSTGRLYMQVNYTLDERRDPVLSTRAAAQLLKRNYRQLGDWPSAVTAYNHGLSGMLRAKKAKGSYEAAFKSYRSRSFKFASRNFYAEFIAARRVAKAYRRYFGPLKIEPPARHPMLVLNGYAAFQDVTRHTGVDAETLQALNPALRPPVFSGRKYIPKGYRLRLPDDLKNSRRLLAAGLPPDLYKSRQKRSRFYIVRRGDTPGAIARRHGLKLSELMAANDLSLRATIYAGQNLRLPVPGERPARPQRVARARLAEKKPPLALTPLPAPAPRTLAMAEPAPAAKTEPAPAAATTAAPAADSEPPSRPAETPPVQVTSTDAPAAINPGLVTGNLRVERVVSRGGQRLGVIRVQISETLGHYADWLGVSARRIRRLNGFRYTRLIRINEPVKIPLGKVSKEAFEEKRYEYHKEITEDFLASYRVQEVQRYSVKSGDNIWKLCREVFEVPFWLVSRYNPHLDLERLSPSQTLLIPVVQEIS
jgi:membrane-bound lytic murein transglycosylase D